MGRFSGLGSVRTNSGGLFFLVGDYVVDIDEVKMISTRGGPDAFIVSAIVVESTVPERAPGCKPSWVLKFKPDILATVLGNAKQFAAAVMGIHNPDAYVPPGAEGLEGEALVKKQDEFWERALEVLVSDKQPARGTRMRLNCANKKTKAGKDFTMHVWSQYQAA